MFSITTRSNRQQFISLQPLGYRSRRIYKGAVSTWCEVDQRGLLQDCLNHAANVARRLTKAGLIEAITILNPNACGLGGTRDNLKTHLQNMLIDVWMPYRDVGEDKR